MKALETRFLKLILAVVIIVFVIWLMSVLKCEMAPPAYCLRIPRLEPAGGGRKLRSQNETFQ